MIGKLGVCTISLIFTLLALEGLAKFGNKEKWFTMVPEQQLRLYLNNDTKKIIKPTYIPHPYFGNVYHPETQIDQGAHIFETNSQGFVDEEFPTKRTKGLCVFALLGGSSAMSWGVPKKEDWINHQLEKRLNNANLNEACEKYRVLNLSIGSQHQYQATQIFMFYKRILDGVIFISGNNACSHGSFLNLDEPIQFPVVNPHATLKHPSYSINELAQKKEQLEKIARYYFSNPFFLELFIGKFVFSRIAQNLFDEIDTINLDIKNDADLAGQKLPHVKGHLVQPEFKDFDWHRFMYFDYKYQRKVLEKLMPEVYFAPLINASYIADQSKIKFMWIVQPLLGATDKQLTISENKLITGVPTFQKACDEVIEEHSHLLTDLGIVKHNLNHVGLFNKEKADHFIDPTHFTPLGARTVAEYLYNKVTEEWF